MGNWKNSQFHKNYKTIIASVLLAFLLWFMVKMNKVYEYSLDIPIHYINIDSDKIFKYPQFQQVRVGFVGKGLDLLRLPFYHLEYQIDLSGFPMHTELDLAAHPEYVKFPGELQVSVKSVIRPRMLTIELDQKVERKLPVKVVYRIQTPPGYLLAGVQPDPDSVLVIGPAAYFREAREMFTVKKEFPPRERPFTVEFPIQKPEKFYTEIHPEKVRVRFDIQRLAERLISDVPVEVVNVPRNMRVIPLPSTAAIYVKGGEKLLAELTPDDFKIRIDFRRDWHPGTRTVKADIITQADILYVESRPSRFELIVQKVNGKK